MLVGLLLSLKPEGSLPQVGILLKLMSHTYQILYFLPGMIGQSHKTAILHNAVKLQYLRQFAHTKINLF